MELTPVVEEAWLTVTHFVLKNRLGKARYECNQALDVLRSELGDRAAATRAAELAILDRIEKRSENLRWADDRNIVFSVTKAIRQELVE